MKTKKLLTMCLLAFLGNMAVHAYDIDQNGIYYNITSDNTVEVTYVEDGEGNADFYYGAISIPRRISTGGVSYTVTAIGDKAFNNCSDVTSVTLPNTVTTIGSNAFDRCTSLTGIDIPNSVTSIGNDAFSGCSSLTSIIIPESVTTIGEDAFWLTGLTSITIPNSVISIGKRIIAHSRVSSIIVEEGNTKYDSRDNCNAIIESETNTLIVGCSNTFIPNTVTTIGECAFERCGELTSIIIPNNVTSIANSAFYNCVNLISVTIPNTITSIGDYMFSFCYKLASVNIPNSVTSIGVQAFNGCSSLSKIEIPNSVTSIGESAFNECGNLVTVKVDIDSPLTIDENTFSNRTNATLYVPAGCKDAYEDADYWTEFSEIVEMPGVGYKFTAVVPCNGGTANMAFNVTSTRPREVEVTWDRYENSSYAGDVVIPEHVDYKGVTYTVTRIGNQAFSRSPLTSVSIPHTVTSISEYAFRWNENLTKLVIPNSVTDMSSIIWSPGPNFTQLIVEEGNPKYDSRNNCNAIIETATNTLINGCQTTIIPDDVETIGNVAFCEHDYLTHIEIPRSVKKICTRAFWGTSLESVNIPEGVEEIDGEAFSFIGSLTYVSLPSTLTRIDPCPFIRSVSRVVVADNNPIFDSRDNCNAIIETSTNKLVVGCRNTIIPETVTSIGGYAFYELYNGNPYSITIPANVLTIEDGAFVQPHGGSIVNEVIVEHTSPIIISGNVFSNRSDITLCVPAGSKVAYEEADYWNEFKEIVEMPGVGYEFTAAVPCNDGTANLTFKVTSTRPWEVEVSASPEDIAGALTIPAMVEYNGLQFAVKSIGKHAFDGGERENAHSITSVTIAEGITTIDNWAFQNCPELETVILPESVENIYSAAFAYSPKLSAINIPTRLKTIYDWLFVNCTALKSIDLPEGITEIKNDAFKGSGLESIKFPSTLTSVGQAAFQACENLTQIDFGGCTATIEGDAFSWCNSLEEVYIPNTITLTGYFTFAVCESLREVIFEEGNPSEGICQTFIGAFIQPSLETVVLPSTAIMGNLMFQDCTKLKSVTFLSGAPSDNSNHYAKNFFNVPDDVLFTIPEGTAESYLRAGFKNLSDLSGLPLVREEFEAEATRISQMADALTDGDKATLTTAISEARAAVNAANDYATVYAQIAAIKSAAKTYLLTATLPANTDVTAAAITNPDFDRFDIGWSLEYIGHKLGYQDKEDNNHFENGDVVMDNFIEAWHGSLSYLSDGILSQTITRLTAGIYRLEADIIAACEYDASVEVTGVSLFAGNQSTPVATENEKPQHFSVKFENATARDVTIGIDINGTNANWVAMDNVRLIYEGKAASLPQGAELVSSETDTLYLYNVDADKYLSAGHSCGTHAILDETGLPLRLTKNEETGLWQIYFWEGSLSQKLLFQEYKDENPNTYVDYNDHGNPWWNITQVSDGTLLIQNEASAADKYLGNDPSKQDLQGNYNGVSFTDVNATVSADKNIHWLLFSKAACDMIIAKRKLMDAILRMEKAGVADIATLLNTAISVYENDEATLKEVIDITTLLNSQMGMPKTDEPVDMTALIINPRFENNTTEGWSRANVVGGRSDATSNQEQEFFEKDFNMYQVITGVPNGRYMLKWKGFHRPGQSETVYNEYIAGTNNASVVVYANEVQKTMKHIASEMSETQLNGGDREFGGKYFPNNMEGTRLYFDAGFYADQLEVEVTDNVLTIGIKNTQPMSTNHWVI